MTSFMAKGMSGSILASSVSYQDGPLTLSQKVTEQWLAEVTEQWLAVGLRYIPNSVSNLSLKGKNPELQALVILEVILKHPRELLTCILSTKIAHHDKASI